MLRSVEQNFKKSSQKFQYQGHPMMAPILLLILIIQQLALYESASHSQASRTKVKAIDIVRTINRASGITWKASTYKMKEVDLNLIAKTKLGVKMEDMQGMNVAEMRKLEKESSNSSTNQTGLPENFSWVSSKRTTCPIGNIRDQSNCGSCWAVAPASILSDKFCLKSNGSFRTPLSSEKIFTCSKNNFGCDGGYMYFLYQYLMDVGTITGGEYESDQGCQQYTVRPCGFFSSKMPCDYSDAITPKCKGNRCNNDWYKYKEEKVHYKIQGYKEVSAFLSDNQARQEIYDNGPILALFRVYPDFIFYRNGIYVHRIGWRPLGGHAVKVVGWGVENGTKYWHVANSWGKYWGENGFFRIRRGSNECSFDYYLTALIPAYNNTKFNP